MNEITDNDVKKALECCIINNCSECPYYKKWATNRCGELGKKALDLINRLEKENTDLFYKLTGVMHFVDKWLEGDELKQDEVNRAITMREKTLQIVEKRQSEYETVRKSGLNYMNKCNELQAEIKRLEKLIDAYFKVCIGMTKELIVNDKELEKIKSEVIKEFWDRLSEKADLTQVDAFHSAYVIKDEDAETIIKEMTEVCE